MIRVGWELEGEVGLNRNDMWQVMGGERWKQFYIVGRWRSQVSRNLLEGIFGGVEWRSCFFLRKGFYNFCYLFVFYCSSCNRGLYLWFCSNPVSILLQFYHSYFGSYRQEAEREWNCQRGVDILLYIILMYPESEICAREIV